MKTISEIRQAVISSYLEDYQSVAQEAFDAALAELSKRVPTSLRFNPERVEAVVAEKCNWPGFMLLGLYFEDIARAQHEVLVGDMLAMQARIEQLEELLKGKP
jgi:hypothetical protein